MPDESVDQKFLTPAEVVRRYKGALTEGTLANWRAGKEGSSPPYLKIGKAVLYPIDALIEWEKRRTRDPTKPMKSVDAA